MSSVKSELNNFLKTNKTSFMIASAAVFMLSMGLIFEPQNAFAGALGCDDGYCPPVLTSATPMGISIELEWTQAKKGFFNPRGFDIIETGSDLPALGKVGDARGSDRSFKVNNLEPNTEYCFEIVNDWRFHSDQTSNNLCATTGSLGTLVEMHCDIDGSFSTDPNERSGEGECMLVYDNGGMKSGLELEWTGEFEVSEVEEECSKSGSSNSNIAGDFTLTLEDGTISVTDAGDMCRTFLIFYSLDGEGTIVSSSGIFAGAVGTSETDRTIIPIKGKTSGEIWIIFSSIGISSSSDSIPYPDPNLGDPKHGQGHSDGFCMNQNCMDVTGLFNHFPEAVVPQGSTQSFSLLISCPRGALTCDHISLAGALPDADFYDDRWTVSLDKQPTSDLWDMTVMNDYGEINADGVTATTQVVSQTFITATINVPFVIPGSIGSEDGVDATHANNRHLHVVVHDSHGGASNYIFNEGMYVQDIYVYPQVDTSYEVPLEYEPLCLNEDSSKRHTCAFDKVKDWTIKNAEEKLKEINNPSN